MTSRTRDHKGRPVVAVTGLGLVTSLGAGKHTSWARLVTGQSGVKSITRFPTDGLKTTIAGTVDDMDVAPYSAHDLAIRMAEAAAAEAIAQARIGRPLHFPGPLIVATPPSEFEWPHLRAMHGVPGGEGLDGYARMLANARTRAFDDLARHIRFAAISDRLKAAFGTQGEPLSICTACASGATTIQLGLEAIRRGDTEAALCVGADATVHPEGLIRFSLLSALSTANDEPTKASKPFSKGRDGFVMAEGAGALVLESYDAARARGARILAIVRGCGEKADEHHRTRSRPDGAAVIGAIRKTLDDAGVHPDEIDYVNAHGTSTPENDRMEYFALGAVMGDRLRNVPVSSNKSMIGHTLIAAGSVEAVFSVLTIESAKLPPTINYDPDPELPLDVVPDPGRESPVATVLSNSFGFGGQNVCVVFSAEPA
ncbi:3-oxoacyl-ACP synthase [Hyphomicrobium nitrativorans NL23]|uniref:3-oxoacyl-ACP synthase n=1 Tax=Hyphomicrobium nitrativorans NL23 TaxID=1029756 RepID=V5SE38_9HYPH|nr:beta-ketoacyl-ACP synthase [Hyphomicrobium nitrativorans]AHB48229.1 3-oxoacyl-ACP synthase [Hyphomicrobium nitrativorans NL23]